VNLLARADALSVVDAALIDVFIISRALCTAPQLPARSLDQRALVDLPCAKVWMLEGMPMPSVRQDRVTRERKT
jgi:hypothetical protein